MIKTNVTKSFVFFAVTNSAISDDTTELHSVAPPSHTGTSLTDNTNDTTF